MRSRNRDRQPGSHFALTNVRASARWLRKCKTAAISGRHAAGVTGHLRRTRHSAVGAEDTAITRLWPEQRVAALALVKEDTGIRRHRFRFSMAALGTGDRR